MELRSLFDTNQLLKYDCRAIGLLNNKSTGNWDFYDQCHYYDWGCQCYKFFIDYNSIWWLQNWNGVRGNCYFFFVLTWWNPCVLLWNQWTFSLLNVLNVIFSCTLNLYWFIFIFKVFSLDSFNDDGLERVDRIDRLDQSTNPEWIVLLVVLVVGVIGVVVIIMVIV